MDVPAQVKAQLVSILSRRIVTIVLKIPLYQYVDRADGLEKSEYHSALLESSTALLFHQYHN